MDQGVDLWNLRPLLSFIFLQARQISMHTRAWKDSKETIWGGGVNEQVHLCSRALQCCVCTDNVWMNCDSKTVSQEIYVVRSLKRSNNERFWVKCVQSYLFSPETSDPDKNLEEQKDWYQKKMLRTSKKCSRFLQSNMFSFMISISALTCYFLLQQSHTSRILTSMRDSERRYESQNKSLSPLTTLAFHVHSSRLLNSDLKVVTRSGDNFQ